ncbi:glycogen synthase, partial [bacterium]
MKVLFISSECLPFAKTGGLGDVVGVLPKVLNEKGIDVRVIIPLYKDINNKNIQMKELADGLHVMLGPVKEYFSVKETTIGNNIKIYFIDNKKYFDRQGIYGSSAGAYSDNAERFIFFSRAVIEAVKAINFQPDIMHAHDWHTALVPAYLKTVYKSDNFFYRTSSVFTIHNMAHQGICPSYIMPFTGISWEEFNMSKMEYYGNINILKAGIVYSDIITSVSKSYNKEIQHSKELGRGLEGVLAGRA